MGDTVVDQVEEPSAPSSEAEVETEEVEERAERAAPEEGKEEKPKEPAKPPRKVKVGDLELDLDSDDFKKVKATEMVRGAQETFRKAKQARDEAEQIRQQALAAIRALKDRPEKALETAGLDEKSRVAMAEAIIAREMIRRGINPETGEALTAEQVRAIQAQEAAEAARREAEELRSKQESAQREQLKNAVRSKLDREMTEALKATGLPSTPHAISRLAELMLEFDFEAPAADLASLVADDLARETQAFLKTLPAEQLVKVIPKETLDALRKWDVEQARKGKLDTEQKARVFSSNKDWADQRRKRVTNPQEAQAALEEWAGSKA